MRVEWFCDTVVLKSAPGTSVIVTIAGQFPSATETIPATGGSVNLNGLASVTFPDGAFSFAQTVTVSASNSPSTHEDFSATAQGPRLPYEIRVNAGTTPPSKAIEVVINIPEGFATSLASDRQLEIFTQPLETSTIEALGHFHGFPSTFNSADKTLRATLPPEAFTDLRSLDGSFEAILIVGDVPKFPNTIGPSFYFPQSGESAKRKHEEVMLASLDLMALLAEPTPICEGSPLGSPLEGDLIVRDHFNPPHNGVDYRAPLGTNIHPVAPGIVSRVGFDFRKLPKPNPRTGKSAIGWGRYVIITHDDGSQTLYAHLIPESTSHLIENVTRVSPSDVIGQSGESGVVTAPHLHLEYSPTGNVFNKRSLVDPQPCVLEGQAPPEPLVLSPQNPTLTCPNGSVTFTASGGTPPYTWSTTKGTITPSGGSNPSAKLTTSSVVVGAAYQCCANPESDNLVCGTLAQASFGTEFGCNDNPLNNIGSIACHEMGLDSQNIVCCNAPGFAPCVNCSDFPYCHISITDYLTAHPGVGNCRDVRTAPMIAAGCWPCHLMKGGATVTVKDASGAQANTTVTVQ